MLPSYIHRGCICCPFRFADGHTAEVIDGRCGGSASDERGEPRDERIIVGGDLPVGGPVVRVGLYLSAGSLVYSAHIAVLGRCRPEAVDPHGEASGGDTGFAVIPPRATVLDVGVTQQFPPFSRLYLAITENHDVVVADGHYGKHGGTASVHTDETVLPLNCGEVAIDNHSLV